MSTAQILRGIYSNRYWLALGMIIACGCAILWNKRYPPLYSSTIEVFVDERYVSPEILSNVSHLPTQGAKRAFHEASSSSILQHLSTKFDLAAHYRILKDRPYGEQIILQKLKGRMHVRLVDQNTLRITIKDANRDIAAMMASEIFTELKKRNDARLALDIHHTHQLYQTVLKDIEQNINKSEERIRSLLGSLTDAAGNDRSTFRSGDLLSLIEKMDRSNKEFAQVSRTDHLVTALAKKEHLPQMLLVQNATIDLDHHPIIISSIRVAGVALTSLLIMVLALIYYYRNRQQFILSMEELFPGTIGSRQGSNLQRKMSRPTAEEVVNEF